VLGPPRHGSPDPRIGADLIDAAFKTFSPPLIGVAGAPLTRVKMCA
jgi:hypothetical protein